MDSQEKKVLQNIVNFHKGSLSPAEMGSTSGHNWKIVNNLIAKNFLEQFNEYINGNTYNFYRVSEKGLIYFSKWYKKLFFYIKSDLRSIIVSIITTVFTYLIIKLLN